MDNTIFNYAIKDGFLWSEVNLKGEKKYFIEGYASTIDEDKAGEILDYSAQEDIYKQVLNENITMDIEHEEWYSSEGKILARPKNEKIPVAKIVDAELKPRGVWVKAQINTNLRSFNELWGSIKDGFLKAFSVAFYPIQKSGGVIKHLNLVNVTLTGSPVNPNATFAVSMKSASAWMDIQEQQLKAKVTEDKMKCKECDKEFDDKEKLAEHQESAHGKEEKKEKPESKEEPKEAKVKSEEVVAEVKAEPIVAEPVIDIKAMKDAHAAELKALNDRLAEAEKNHSTELASLKAELSKPVMKAQVEATMPDNKPIIQVVSPLQLVR